MIKYIFIITQNVNYVGVKKKQFIILIIGKK